MLIAISECAVGKAGLGRNAAGDGVEITGLTCGNVDIEADGDFLSFPACIGYEAGHGVSRQALAVFPDLTVVSRNTLGAFRIVEPTGESVAFSGGILRSGNCIAGGVVDGVDRGTAVGVKGDLAVDVLKTGIHRGVLGYRERPCDLGGVGSVGVVVDEYITLDVGESRLCKVDCTAEFKRSCFRHFDGVETRSGEVNGESDGSEIPFCIDENIGGRHRKGSGNRLCPCAGIVIPTAEGVAGLCADITVKGRECEFAAVGYLVSGDDVAVLGAGVVIGGDSDCVALGGIAVSHGLLGVLTGEDGGAGALADYGVALDCRRCVAHYRAGRLCGLAGSGVAGLRRDELGVGAVDNVSYLKLDVGVEARQCVVSVDKSSRCRIDRRLVGVGGCEDDTRVIVSSLERVPGGFRVFARLGVCALIENDRYVCAMSGVAAVVEL